MTELMRRRRALMIRKATKKNGFVDGTYGDTTTVTNGNHINANPMKFNYTTQIPLLFPVEVGASFEIMISETIIKGCVFCAYVDGTRTEIVTGTSRPAAGVWYTLQTSGTVDKMGFYSGQTNNYFELDISVRVDGEVLF